MLLESKEKIDDFAKFLLRESKALGAYPTPVNDIIAKAELKIDLGVDLGKIKQGFFSNKLDILKSALDKILGLTIPRRKVIYLDLSLLPGKQNFVKLHETGHNYLPWQAKIYSQFEDDDVTLEGFHLDDEIKALYEREASYFASAVLFQLDKFNDEAARLPLSISSPLHLGKKFGSSIHAAIRRYVEFSPKRCALLVLNKPDPKMQFSCEIRNFFASKQFEGAFGKIKWPKHCNFSFPFVKDFAAGKKHNEEGFIAPFEGNPLRFDFLYHYFSNTYHAFVMLIPIDERIRSRTSFKIYARES
jgi:hypothetical protein